MQQEKSQPFTREDMKSAPQKLLRDGRTANAVVTKIEAAGRTWTVKDFSSRPWFVRWFIAPVLLSRELAFLNRLEGVDGIADSAFRIDRYAIAVQFMPGESIGKRVKERVTPDFLEKLEALVDAMHARGVVHLDLRGLGNVMIRPDDTPGIIDFQSSLFTDRMPRGLRKILEDFDFSGVLKKWAKYQPEAMGDARKAELERINKVRRFWVFRGYFGMKKKKRR
ncbi:hypothetical protein H6A60_00045 [Sutterella massiliensis]|uniref:Protein kinase domain-containing protein n=1 Tax=Sutterella massiliensis TaxID=1816689 RepID=A0ABS2DNB9_9BURK|nr:hypothetical protein [Sutterella massiliensis]MBM6702905.1 hypothetical protein [Sutterella massiliensis]